MKLHLIDRSSKENSSITVTKNSCPNFLKIWHYHPELELVYVMSSKGTRFIGDSIEKFEEGDVVLIGKDLPHMWLNDEAYFREDSTLVAEALGVHFREDFLGYDFINAPEMTQIRDLFYKAKFGIRFNHVGEDLKMKIAALSDASGFNRTMLFIEVLDKLARHESCTLLASQGYVNTSGASDHKYLDLVYEYVFNNFKKDITLTQVAKIAHMNPSAFSRLFKRVNRKTFTRYVNEIRIGYACRLLIENKQSITDICYESGFNNISNFNRQFKNITSLSPSTYLNRHHNI